ncbi:MAG: hypothetical protein KAI94_14575, partial [Anaerolineales bacterium]|nr:hypothetical protein [Anaerolineales bacterium]
MSLNDRLFNYILQENDGKVKLKNPAPVRERHKVFDNFTFICYSGSNLLVQLGLNVSGVSVVSCPT